MLLLYLALRLPTHIVFANLVNLWTSVTLGSSYSIVKSYYMRLLFFIPHLRIDGLMFKKYTAITNYNSILFT